MKTGIKMKVAALALSAALLAPIGAGAQQSATYGKVEQPWLKQGKASGGIAVTNATGRTLLPAIGLMAWVCNTGANDAYLEFGDVTVTATATGGTWLRAGACGTYDLFPFFNSARSAYIAAITASSTTTLSVETGIGNGPPQPSLSGTVTVTGSVTANAGTNLNTSLLALEAGGNLASLVAQIGAVTASPTANTVLDRIKTINTTLGAAPMQQTGGSVTAAASENHIGEVGGNILPITNAMTTSNATVTTGQSIGGIQTLANAVRVSGSLGASGTSGLIQSVVLTFQDAVGSGPLDVYFYNATVTTGSNCANATTFVLQTADRPNVLGVAHVTDFTASNTAVVAQANNLAIPFGLASSTSLFACVVARASFAITGTTNASLKVNVLRN